MIVKSAYGGRDAEGTSRRSLGSDLQFGSTPRHPLARDGEQSESGAPDAMQTSLGKDRRESHQPADTVHAFNDEPDCGKPLIQAEVNPRR